MFRINLLNNNSEIIQYKNKDFLINSNEYLLSNFPHRSVANHWHSEFEFTIILSGKMSYSVNGKAYDLEEGQGIFINSNQLHYGFATDDSDCKFICVQFNPSLTSNINHIEESYITPICEDISHPFFIFNKSISWQREVIETLIKIHNIFKTEEEGFELQLMSNFYSILYVLYNIVKNNISSQEDYYNKDLIAMHNMIGYIQNNYKNKITLNDIAASANVCRSNCCRIFQTIINKSPIAYLMEYRLNESIKILNRTQCSIIEIALNCGFNSSSYFTEIFHKNMGCTPSEYRKNIS